jgi:alcohol dehydrogenase
VPTTAGTGSETQSFTLVTHDDTGLKMACGDPRAAFRIAILDVALTLTQPAAVAAATGVDAVAHAVESHVSRAATPASRVFSREAWRLLAAHLPAVLAGGGTLGDRSAVQFGAALAGLAIENSMLGAAHALANPLTAAHGIVHGQAVGLALPHVVRFNAPACGPAYAELLTANGTAAASASAGEILAAWIDDLLAAAGFPTTLTRFGVSTPDVPALAAAAPRSTRPFDESPTRRRARRLVACASCPWTKPSTTFVHLADRSKSRGFRRSAVAASGGGRLVPQSAHHACG